MELVLNESMFTGNKCTVIYEGGEALFTIVDEEFMGNNRLGRINQITILTRKTAEDGQTVFTHFGSSVIGLGDGVVGVRSEEPTLRGKLLNRDNMSQCVVELYEDG